MKLEIDIPEHQYNNIIALNSLSLGRMPYKGIIMYAINAIKKAQPLPKGDFIAVCKSDYSLTEEAKKSLKDTAFISDDPKYCFEITEIKELMNKDTLTTVIPQEPILEMINKMKSEIADSLEFWDYSPNNNPLARDMIETLTNYLGAIRGEEG